MARKELEDWFWQVDASLRGLSEAGPQGGPLTATSRCWVPRVDLTETAERYELRVELAGVCTDNVQVVYLPDRHSLLVRGVRLEEGCEDEGARPTSAHVLEIFYGEFAREVRLPDAPIEAQSITSAIQDGLLTVCVPKARMRLSHTRVTIRKV